MNPCPEHISYNASIMSRNRRDCLCYIKFPWVKRYMGYHVVYHSHSVAFCSFLNDKEKQLLSVKTFTSMKFCDEIQASRLPGIRRSSHVFRCNY